MLREKPTRAASSSFCVNPDIYFMEAIMAKQTQQQDLAAQILASIQSPSQTADSAPIVDFVVDKTASAVDGASRLAGAFGSAFKNAASFYKLERGVQVVRSEMRLKKAAEDAAARILALQ